MTARVCPVHGEYAADGICRWCEPPKRTPTNLPAGSTPCRCGEYAWLPGAVGERNGVIAGVAHSPEQCFKLEPKPPEYDHEYDHTEAVIDPGMRAIQESLLLAQHAALRWERVARRWATKAKFDGHERTVDGTLAFDDRCSECRRTRRLTDAGIPKEWP